METVILKYGITFLMAFLFGIERQFSNKLVGFGTFIFVAIGSCSMGLIAMEVAPGDQLAVVGGTLSGIGFIGAGALIRNNDKIFGFTTAASIWIFAIIGLAVGFGEYLIALVGYLTIWIVILFDRVLEFKGIGSYQRKLIIKTNKIVGKEMVLKLLKYYRWKLVSFEVDVKNNQSSMIYLVSGPRSFINSLKEKFQRIEWVESFSIS